MREGSAVVSIKDVAKLANVSIATVSRAINNSNKVTPKTRAAVLSAIRELQYYPNAAARSLKNDVSLSLGFLVSDISNSFFISAGKAIEDGIGGKGYNIFMCSTNQRKDREYSYLQMLMGKQVDGLILNITGENDSFISEISKNIPIILLERRVSGADFIGDYVANDNTFAVQKMVAHLIERNHRRIAVINGPLYLSNAAERYSAFVKEMKQAGIDVNDDYPYRVDSDFMLGGGYEAAKQLFSREDRPTAIIIMNNLMAVGVYQYLRQMNIRVPDEVSVVHYGDIGNSSILYVQPTYITLNAEYMGKKTIEMFFSRLENHALPNRENIFVTDLCVGNTTRSI